MCENDKYRAKYDLIDTGVLLAGLQTLRCLTCFIMVIF
jgi:hypothetical protein